MDKLYKTNKTVFWLIAAILSGIIFGLFNSDLRAGIIYGSALFIIAILYEVFINKENRPKE